MIIALDAQGERKNVGHNLTDKIPSGQNAPDKILLHAINKPVAALLRNCVFGLIIPNHATLNAPIVSLDLL